MSTITKTGTDTRYVVTADGLRMSYREWLDMKRSEMN